MKNLTFVPDFRDPAIQKIRIAPGAFDVPAVAIQSELCPLRTPRERISHA